MALTIGDNFDYKGQKPNFARDSFDTLADMKAFAETSIDDGHISFCKEDSKHYVYNSANEEDATTGKWREFSGVDDVLTAFSAAVETDAEIVLPAKGAYGFEEFEEYLGTNISTYSYNSNSKKFDRDTDGKISIEITKYVLFSALNLLRDSASGGYMGDTSYVNAIFNENSLLGYTELASTGDALLGTITGVSPLLYIQLSHGSLFGNDKVHYVGVPVIGTFGPGLMTQDYKKKLDEIEEGANKTTVTPALTEGTLIAEINGTKLYAPVAGESVTYSQATSNALGLVKLGSDTVQTVEANSPSATEGKTYPVQVNSNGQAVVNVPWTDTNTTYSTATAENTGLVALGSNIVQTVAANEVTSAASRTYAVQLNGNNQMVVNVPWTDNNTTYSSATSSALGLVKLGDDTVQTVAANAVTSTVSRTYAVQVNSDNQLVVNVPWSDTTYSVATTSANGLMSSADKAKLDGIAENADVTSVTAALSEGTLVAEINGVKIYAPTAGESVTYDKATASVLGLVALGSDTVQTVAANSVTSTASRTYAVQMNSANQLVVNVPWTDTNTDTTYDVATSTDLGLVKLGSDTVQTVAAATPTATASRTYAVQKNSDNQLVVNVPWTDTNTTYSAATSEANGLMSAIDKSRLDEMWEWFNDIKSNTEGVIVTLDE